MRAYRQREITVYGRVQGVGFRPYVAGLAEELGLSGDVRNTGGIVTIRVSGTEGALDELVHRLSVLSEEKRAESKAKEELPKARVDRIEVSEKAIVPGKEEKNPVFRIAQSGSKEDRIRFLPPDIATCDNCLRELFDPKNRRYRYPFISCTACGPRFSIMEGIPYDRDTITMSDFAMCPACGAEYRRKGDVRRHAQTIACEDCGPELSLYVPRKGTGELSLHSSGRQAWEDAVEMIKAGKIVAIKDIGGYHLALDPMREDAAQRLRQCKNRERKPFAVMFADTESAAIYGRISRTEQRLLESDARPIVLLKKKKNRDFVPGVCGNSDRIGALLPCNPLQHLIIRKTGPLVMTSANRGGEPIITEDEQMFVRMRDGVCDAVLANDRRICFGLDDSICQVSVCGDREVIQIIRRARGYVPEPVPLPRALAEDVFAAGGDLKAVFALGRDNMAYLSGHYGDLDDMRAAALRREAAGRIGKLLGIAPVAAVCDAHPGYVSSGEVNRDFPPEKVVPAGHHRAHVAAVIAEYDLREPVIGVAYDGTGYGDDRTIWGGEIFFCEGGEYQRAAHIRGVMLTGGDSAAKNASVTACCYLNEAVKSGYLNLGEAEQAADAMIDPGRRQTIWAAQNAGINTVLSTSMGRLFDAVSALLGICLVNSYEGECPQLLQMQAERYPEQGAGEAGEIDLADEDLYSSGNVRVWDSVKAVARLVRKKLGGEDAGKLAREFHEQIARMTAALCRQIAADHGGGIRAVALSGGTMYNGLLLKLLLPLLRENGFEAYVNEKVPSGDGGLAYGQLYLYDLRVKRTLS